MLFADSIFWHMGDDISSAILKLLNLFSPIKSCYIELVETVSVLTSCVFNGPQLFNIMLPLSVY